MEEFFATCAADQDCAAQYPDLEQTFRDLVDELNAEPVPITVVLPSTGERVEDELDGNGLVGFPFQSLYSTPLLPFLPEIISAAEDDEFGTIGLLLGAFAQQLDLVNIGQQLTVQCQEEIPFGTRDEVSEAAEQHPLLDGFLQASPTLGPRIFEVCASWEAGQPPAGGRGPGRQ